MRKTELLRLSNIFANMNDFIDSTLCPPNNWKAAITRGVVIAYRNELIKRIMLCLPIDDRYGAFKDIEFEIIAKGKFTRQLKEVRK